jgi:NAD(P)H dehydrogenase (quinone)
MKHLVLRCHPTESGYCASLARTYVTTLRDRGQSVTFHDLYRAPIAGVLSAQEYQATRRGAYEDDLARVHGDVRAAEAITFFFPLWWMGFPALLKGWIDRALSYGFAYEMDGETPLPLLSGRRAATVATMGTTREDYKKDGSIAAMEHLWREHVFGFCGIRLDACLWLGNASLASDEERADHRAEVEVLASQWPRQPGDGQ